MPDRKTLYLIDGSSYVYRAFYAIRGGLSTSGGLPTNAVYGFCQMIIKVLKDEEPDLLAVAFDTPEPTFRHKEYPRYKANRPPMPEELAPQWPYIRRLTDALNIASLSLPGYEADDILGTLAKEGERQGYQVTILSGDKDMFQLITPRVRMMDSMKEKVFDVEAVKERFGVEPERMIEIFGLMGDQADNIPGVPGVGEKTAVSLIRDFHDIENLLSNLDKVKRDKLRQSLRDHTEQARLSKRLVTIDTEAPVELEPDRFRCVPPDQEQIVQLFKELEFTRLIDEFTTTEREETPVDYKLIVDRSELEALCGRLAAAPLFAVDLETTHQEPMRATIVGISLAVTENEAWYIPLLHHYLGVPRQLDKQWVLDTLKPLLEDPSRKKCGQNLKYDMIVFEREGVSLKGVSFDTMIASYLLNPSQRNHNLTQIALDCLNYKMTTYKDVAGSGAKQINFSQVTVDVAKDYSCEDSDISLRLTHYLAPKLKHFGLEDLFDQVEIPLIDVLASMEMNGVKLDTRLMEELSGKLGSQLQLSVNRIYELAGREFNINSPIQLRQVLFEDLGLKPVKKTKTGPSTDVSVLEKLAAEHPLPAEMLEYRQLSKLRSTYADALPKLVNPATGRIHTSFNQTITATGRLSSSNPNLQNIPIRTELGREIRKAFVTEPRHILLSADYSQIELRVLAHLAEDPALIRSFLEKEDIHARTASQVFGVDLEAVNPDQRRMAKAVNFGVLYGMSHFRLARELHIADNVAKEFIDNYFNIYSRVKEFIEQTVADAHRNGYVTTILNRQRHIPELKSSNSNVRGNAERMAVNTPIQGSAADLIKLAMINCRRRMMEEGLKSKMVLQVHDELVFEMPEEEKEAMTALVKEKMEGVMALRAPLVADVETGRNWNDAH